MMMNKEGSEMLTKLGSAMAGIMFVWAMFKQYFPFELQIHFEKYVKSWSASSTLTSKSPSMNILSSAFSGARYLSSNSADRAKRLKAEMVDDSKKLVLSMADYEEITDNFNGVKVWWAWRKALPNSQVISYFPSEDEKRYYKLTFHKRHRQMITGTYLSHVMEQGKAIAVKDRQRKLYTNNSKERNRKSFARLT
ncbi:unnamed protein product, partial [Thlaspi arvense]